MNQKHEARYDWEAALRTAQEAAREAGSYLLSKQGNVHVLALKAQRDMLLDADLEAEQLILHRLKSDFPAAGLLSEEAGETDPGTDYQWLVDPLDGSANFQHGSPVFALSITLLVQRVATVSVIYLPTLNEMFTAMRGYGAALNGHPVRVSETSHLSESIVHAGDFAKDGDQRENERRLTYLSRLASSARSVRMIGTAATDLVSVACGRADALVMYSVYPWDKEAGYLFIQEAGGKVSVHTDTQGKPLCLYSNDKLHQPLFQLLQ